MEFSPRNRAAAPQPATPAHHTQHAASGRRKHIDWAARTVRIELFIVLVGSALLLAAASLFMALSGGIGGEEKRVDESKYQAVFLNGGVTSGSVSYSTYFGKVTKLNDKYMVLNDVYYLTDQQSSNKSSSSSPQLTKLGCQQLHSPYDEMVINRSQIAFWENIKEDGKVAQAIKSFKDQNPNGPDCSQQNQSSNNSSDAQNSNSNNSNTNPSPTPSPSSNNP